MLKSQLPRNWWIGTVVILVICAFVFLLQLVVPGFTENLAMRIADVPAKPYLLITSIFLHGSVMHILFNMFALLIFGLRLEREMGTRDYLLLFLSAGIFANLLNYFTSANVFVLSLGASGAIFGMLGAVAFVRPKDIIYFRMIPMPLIVAAFVWAALEFFSLDAADMVAHDVHLFGLFFGIVFGILLLMSGKGQWGKKIISSLTVSRILTITLAVVLIASCATVALPMSKTISEIIPAYTPPGWTVKSVTSIAGLPAVIYSPRQGATLTLILSDEPGWVSIEECEIDAREADYSVFQKCSKTDDIIYSGVHIVRENRRYYMLVFSRAKAYYFLSSFDPSPYLNEMLKIIASTPL